MASVDTSIYQQIKPFTMEDPMSRYAKGLQIQGAQQQVEQQRRAFQLEDDLSGALTESGGDLTKASQLLAQRGRGNAALQLQGKAIDQRKAQIEQQLKLSEAVSSDGIALDSAWRQLLAKHGGNAQLAMQEMGPIYAGVRQRWAGMGQQLPEQFDPQQNLAGIGQAKEVASYLTKLLPETPRKPTAVQEYEYAKEQGYQGTFQQFQIEQKKAGASNVTLNAGTEKKYGEALAGRIAERDTKLLDVAAKAPELAERANSIISMLNTGKVITGTGADFRLAVGKALNIAGASDAEVIANTEALVSELASTTLDAIASSGLGSGQGFTDKDRTFLQDARAGRIALEENTLRRIATLNHKVAVASAKRWNDRVKQIPDSALEGTGLTRDPIVVPDLDVSKPAAAPGNPQPQVLTDRDVRLPDGRVKTFPTPAAAKRFKEAAGL